MPSPELVKRWRVATALLMQARRAIPDVPSGSNLRFTKLEKQFDEFIAHNELELALDMLEEIAELVPCRGGFWRDLERAADMMSLNQRAQYFRTQFLSTLPPINVSV